MQIFYYLEVARPASSTDKKSLPSLVFLSFGIFLLHSVNEVIRDRKRRLGGYRRQQQQERNGRSYSEDALESLLFENGPLMKYVTSSIVDPNQSVRQILYFTGSNMSISRVLGALNNNRNHHTNFLFRNQRGMDGC